MSKCPWFSCVQMSGLHLAAREGQALALSMLMTSTFINVNIADTWGQTPLDHAVECQQWPCAVLLIGQGGKNRRQNVCESCVAHASLQLPLVVYSEWHARMSLHI